MAKEARKILLFLVLTTLPLVAFSHGNGHSHEPLTREQARSKAAEKLTELANTGKIAASWAGIKAISIEQKAPDFTMEWVVLFKNGKISDKTKQTLYLFFSLDGDFIISSNDGS